MNEHESGAMWSLYLKSNEGIAIQSTYKKLKNSIIDEQEIYLGIIKYIDYEKDYIASYGNLFSPFVHKRKSFEHEKELRAFIMKWPSDLMRKTNNYTEETINGGISIKVDIEELIERIYIAPNAPKWFTNLVIKVVKRYGYDIEVFQSELNNNPMF